LITWKEFSSVEDAIMALSHGVRIAGPPMAARPTVSATAFHRYLALRASVLHELSSRGAEWLEQTPDEPSPNRFYSKAVTRVAREHAYVTIELTPGRIDQLPDAVDACGAPAHVGAIVGRAVSSLVGVPNVRMLSKDEAQEYLAWVNRFEARHGRDEWARLISAPAKVRRPIVDLRKHMDGQFREGNDRV
jgi:hypothetical protein